MGIILKQTIKGSIFSYLGIAIGYLNMIVLMPLFFRPDQVGLTQLMLSFSAIFSLIGTLGSNGVSSRLFPYFRNQENCHNGFSALLIITGFIGFIAMLIAFFILSPLIIESNIEESPLFVEYLYFLIPLIFFRLFFSILDGYNKVLYDAVTGTFWIDFGYKFLNLIFVILFSLEVINFRQYMFGFTFALSFPVFPVLFILIKRNNFSIIPKFHFLKKSLLKQMFIVATYSLMGASSGIIITSIDRIMVNQYLALSTTGIFSICALFATIIKIPFASLNKISTPFLAEAWKKQKMIDIQNIYKKSTINQLSFSTLIFIGIFGNLDNIFRILPSEYGQGRYVVVLYSLAFLIMTSGGAGGYIIGTSSKFRIQTYMMFFTSILTIGLNMLFIPWMGINGAAIATLLTYVISTAFRVLYLKYKMGLFPYNYKYLLVLLIGIVSYTPVLIIGHLNSLILDIGIKSVLITVIFVSLVVLFKISEELNGIFNKYFRLLRNYIIK